MKRRALLAVPFLLSTTPAWAAPTKPVAKPRPKLIALDPGHGGSDPGALGRVSGVQEKNVVIAVSRVLWLRWPSAAPATTAGVSPTPSSQLSPGPASGCCRVATAKRALPC